MRKFALPLILIASVAASSAAMAAAPMATTTTEGVIKALSGRTHMLALVDGPTFKLAKGIKVAEFKVGEKVKVTWEKLGKIDEAIKIVAE